MRISRRSLYAVRKGKLKIQLYYLCKYVIFVIVVIFDLQASKSNKYLMHNVSLFDVRTSLNLYYTHDTKISFGLLAQSPIVRPPKSHSINIRSTWPPNVWGFFFGYVGSTKSSFHPNIRVLTKQLNNIIRNKIYFGQITLVGH